ncbi:MAG: hypothetical protein K2N07_03515 [Desulfovibrio sp.]|nr:hypothetical protein [Desulfovibrio sp.]
MSGSIDIAIRCDGLEAEMRRVEKVIATLGLIKEQKAYRMALRAALTSARKEAARVARTFYTARKAKIFDNVEVKYAEGRLILRAAPGMSLTHFKPTPAVPGVRPSGGVTSQVKRGGPRYAHRDRRYSHDAPFIMPKKQGGLGIFVREKGHKFKDWKGVHMLFGPSPIQSLMRRDNQELVAERATETFRETIQQQIDKLLAAAGGR